MKKIDPSQMDATSEKFWNELKKNWFKVEVLQYYSFDEGESLQAWMAGDKEKSLKLIKKDPGWMQGKENVKKVRIHVVERPLTEYIKWEIEYYKYVNIPKVGEEIYLLNKDKAGGIELPQGDTMIYDDEKVIENIYDKQGNYLGSNIYEEPEEIKLFIEIREQLLKLDLEKVE